MAITRRDVLIFTAGVSAGAIVVTLAVAWLGQLVPLRAIDRFTPTRGMAASEVVKKLGQPDSVERKPPTRTGRVDEAWGYGPFSLPVGNEWVKKYRLNIEVVRGGVADVWREAP